MAYCDFVTMGGVILDVFGDVGIQINLTGFDQLQDGHGRELFGDRTNAKNMVSLHLNIQFKIGHTKCFAVDGLAIFDHQSHTTWAIFIK